MKRRKFIATALAVPIALQFSFAERPTTTITTFFHENGELQHIKFVGDGSRIIATRMDAPTHKLGMVTHSGDGNLSLDRWFEDDPNNPSEWPDSRKLNTLKFVMEKPIDKMRGTYD